MTEEGQHEGQQLAKLIKSPHTARRVIVRQALEKLGEGITPDAMIEAIEELQATLTTHADAFRWVEKLYGRRLADMASALEEQRAANGDLARRFARLRSACSMAVRHLEEDEHGEATEKLREAVEHADA